MLLVRTFLVTSDETVGLAENAGKIRRLCGRISGFRIVSPSQAVSENALALAKVRLSWDAIHSNVIEFKKRPEAVVFLLGNRIKFVVVAASTLQSGCQKSCCRVLHQVLQPDIAVETIPVSRQISSGAQGFGICRCDLITGQHFLDHLIIAFVLVK